MAKDYIEKEGTVLPQKLCDYCGEYVERKCRNRSKCPNAQSSESKPVKIPVGYFFAVVIIAIIIALLVFG